ncbi:tyrosine-type recombinase/integrase [Streptomyces lavendulocolor]|uniref:tyrosine-type recombinase/integrase n=1 Tax=Streptomyces lavendulocolor TaxID=67316 RepID=UPI003C2EEA1D
MTARREEARIIPLPTLPDRDGWLQWMRENVRRDWRPGEWDQEGWLFTADPDSPRNAIWKCQVVACPRGTNARRQGLCDGCKKDWKAGHHSCATREEFIASYVPNRKVRGVDPHDCLVERDQVRCGRVQQTQGLCLSHYTLWHRLTHMTIPEWNSSGLPRPFSVPAPCSVVRCPNKSIHESIAVCTYHLRRWEAEFPSRSRGEEAAIRRWARTQTPVLDAYKFSLTPLSPVLRLEFLLGLQRRDDLGCKIEPRQVRRVIRELAARPDATLTAEPWLEQVFPTAPNARAMAREVTWAVQHAYARFNGLDPWADTRLDLREAGLKSTSRTGRRRKAGVVDLSCISQLWLRRLLRERVEAERPNSAQFGAWFKTVQLASDALNRLPGGGHELSGLGFKHVQAVYDEIRSARIGDGRIYGWKQRACFLGHFFALVEFGRFAELLEGLPGTFARHPSHRIASEDDNEDEIGKAVPEYVIRQLDSHLGFLAAGTTYGDMHPDEIQMMFRTLYVIMRDSGRRPLEIISLPRNCLERDGEEVSLIWDNHKGRRMKRRLPITAETTEAITRWQRTRDHITAPATSDKYLFPAITDRSGWDHMASSTFNSTIRSWVDSLPVLNSDAIDGDGNLIPFERSLIFPYAFRHAFAQRHADAGTPVDVLRDLMDHEDVSTTMGYYRVTLERKRAAVKLLSQQVIDRRGTARPCSQQTYEHRSIAVPFGGCTEPSNVKAGGHACPIRFQCAGCGFYRPDPSYLPAIEDHANSLRADRERARAMDTAAFVIDNLTSEISAYEEIAEKMRDQLADLPADERAETEEAAVMLRRIRAGGDRALLPITVIHRQEEKPK